MASGSVLLPPSVLYGAEGKSSLRYDLIRSGEPSAYLHTSAKKSRTAGVKEPTAGI